MPHVTFVTLAGFRVADPQLLDLGLSLPGFVDRAAALARLPALGLITLAGMFPEDWTCSYHAPAQVDAELLHKISTEAPDLVAISALTPSVLEAYRLSDSLRERQLTTVLGGLHVSVCPQEARQHTDCIVIGSAEPVWLQVLQDLEQGELQPVYRTSRSGTMQNWPLPRFDLLGTVQRYTLQTQRGCPFACDFCGASRLLDTFQEKPLEHIRRELEVITRLRPRTLLELADDNTFAGSRDAVALIETLGSFGVRWFTEADWRLGERTELLPHLAASGCMQVLTGLESLVFRYPGMAAKEADLERMLAACEALQSAGVCVNACFIVGAEGETAASIERLTEFLLQAPFAEVQVTLQTPFPGTGLYHKLSQAGRMLPDRDWSHYTLFDVTYQPDLLTVRELETYFRELIAHVYGPAATARRKQIRHTIWRNNRRLHPHLDRTGG